MNGVCGVCFCTLGLGLDLHISLLNSKLCILLGNLLFRLNANGVCLLLCVCGCNRDVSLRVCLCDLCVLANLLNVVDTHVFNGSGAVFEVLNIEVYNLNTELFHIGNNVFGDLLCNALTVLNHFLQTYRTNDLTHVTLKHLCNKLNEVCLAQIQKRFGCASQKLGVRGNLDVCNAVNGYVDELVCGNSFTCFNVYLHNAQGETVNTGEERHAPTGFTDQDLLFAKTCNDVSSIRGSFEIAAGKQNSNEGESDENEWHSCFSFLKKFIILWRDHATTPIL